MNKLLLPVLAAFTLAGSLSAQTSVWKVTKGDSTLYLGGTCHILRAGDLPLPAEFDQAYAGSQTIVFETDITRGSSPEMQSIIAARGMFGDGTTLDQVVSPEAWAALGGYAARQQLPLAQLKTMRPWLVTMMLAVIELQKLGVTQQGVDAIYHQRAKADGKTIGELESFERQLDYIVGIGSDRPSELILNTLGDLEELPGKLDDLLSAWRKGDLAALERLMNDEMRAKYPDLHAKLLVERNEAWLPVIEKMFDTPEVEFVLAGAGHMSGPEGIIARLRERGCVVEQVMPAAVK